MDTLDLIIYVVGAIIFIWTSMSVYRAYQNDKKPTHDPFFYDQFELKKDDIRLYQLFFDRISELKSVYNAVKMKDISNTDDKKIESLLDEAEKSDLERSVINMMIYQWVFADILFRNIHQKKWAETVFNRSGVGDYPETSQIQNAVEK